MAADTSKTPRHAANTATAIVALRSAVRSGCWSCCLAINHPPIAVAIPTPGQRMNGSPMIAPSSRGVVATTSTAGRRPKVVSPSMTDTAYFIPLGCSQTVLAQAKGGPGWAHPICPGKAFRCSAANRICRGALPRVTLDRVRSHPPSTTRRDRGWTPTFPCTASSVRAKPTRSARPCRASRSGQGRGKAMNAA